MDLSLSAEASDRSHSSQGSVVVGYEEGDVMMRWRATWREVRHLGRVAPWQAHHVSGMYDLGMGGGGQRIKMNHRHRTYLCGVQGSPRVREGQKAGQGAEKATTAWTETSRTLTCPFLGVQTQEPRLESNTGLSRPDHPPARRGRVYVCDRCAPAQL